MSEIGRGKRRTRVIFNRRRLCKRIGAEALIARRADQAARVLGGKVNMLHDFNRDFEWLNACARTREHNVRGRERFRVPGAVTSWRNGSALPGAAAFR